VSNINHLKKAESQKGLTVGDVAKRSGIAVSTVHFYESKGLIMGWRSSGNQRRYHRAVLRRIALIRVAQRAGLQLSVINEVLRNLPSDAPLGKADWMRLTAQWQQLINERIERLLQLRDQLTSCIGCGCLSLKDCPLRNPADILSKEGSGPRRLSIQEASGKDEL
jgi:MerR family redox-sensitive transcriptional activator SoxR